VRALRAWLATAAGLPRAGEPAPRHRCSGRSTVTAGCPAGAVRPRGGGDRQGTRRRRLDPERFSGHSLRAGFCTAAARHGAPTWRIQQISGHTHDAFDYVVAGTRILCNPRGYDPFALNPDFNSALVVAVRTVHRLQQSLQGMVVEQLAGADVALQAGVGFMARDLLDPPGRRAVAGGGGAAEMAAVIFVVAGT